MFYFIDKILTFGFYILFFIIPLILFPQTSEIFEFNKIIIVYISTSIIVSLWIIKIIIRQKFIFRRTILDIPILVFLASQIITTLTSIDKYASVFGYYSRFNGGLLSSVCYCLLFFAYTSNITAEKTKKVIK